MIPLSKSPPHGLAAEAEKKFLVQEYERAERLYRRLLIVEPKSTTALFRLGIIELQRGDKDKAETMFRRCAKLDHRHIGAQVNLGNLLLERERPSAALTCYRAAIQADPGDCRWHHNLGKCLWALDRIDEAIAAYRQALRLNPDYDQAALDLGRLLRKSGNFAEAEAIWTSLVAMHPAKLEPRLELGKLYRALRRGAQARAQYEAALHLHPGHPEVQLGLSWALTQSHDLKQARFLLARALRDRVPDANALAVAAELHAGEGDYPLAIDLMQRAINAGARGVFEYQLLANWYVASSNRTGAIGVLQAAIERHGDRDPTLLVSYLYNLLCLCDWRLYQKLLKQVQNIVAAPEPVVIQPFIALQLPGMTPQILLSITQSFVRQYTLGLGESVPARIPRHSAGRRLRLGYLSADFREHATAYLTASVFEEHDRERFEVFGYTLGQADNSPTLRRLRESFDHFVDLAPFDHRTAAQRIHADEIDILIDLKGYTRHSRPEILALKPATIQVNWLGYPGTMAADFMDYIIVDPTVVPADEEDAYTEALAYMPHAYAPIDLKRQLNPTPSRAEVGLPETGFVFCCFNNPRKIMPEVFDCWCRLLNAIPGAVLWLYAISEAITLNLRQEAVARGLDPNRLVFVPFVTQADHLARLPLADLVLDTLPYNAHTTTSDALMMGVPVLTCVGNTFPGRVAASLLRAAGLPDLVTFSQEDYERRASQLATNPTQLEALKHRLRTARYTEPYFDLPRFTRNLEGLFLRMWNRFEKGLSPVRLDPT